jgi:hypothetical protein
MKISYSLFLNSKGIFPNGVTAKKCTAFFSTRGASSPYWMGLGENSGRR